MTKIYKTNTRHFKVFQEHVRHWVDSLSLNEWKVCIEHLVLDADCYGDILTDCKGRCCVIRLNHNWDEPATNAKLKSTARHEALELLIADSYGLWRGTERQRIIVGHAIIRRLEHVFDKAGML